MLVVKESLSQSHPAAVKEIFRALRASKPAAPAPGDFDAIQFGVENVRRALELIIKYSAQQKLIPRRFEVDELFDEMTRGLN
jgi:4,5-dihydroxyphthalate decarboxylase